MTAVVDSPFCSMIRYAEKPVGRRGAMKQWIRFGAAALLALALCVGFGRILTAYYQPMDSAAYDLSLGWEGEAVPDDWVYDQKGWAVFTQEGDAVTELTADGFGGFTGLSEPGQTFYFSRVLSEEVDSPTLRLDGADRTFAVFLDGTLIYTNCPELDNRMGFLRLPMLGWYRDEPLLIALPLDCAGKTLTIAQSTDLTFEESRGRVWPCAVTLYCGYAYESSLISESFQAAIPAALAFAAGLALLALFLRQAFQRRLDPGTLCGALAAFSYLTARIAQPSFAYLYFGITPVDPGLLCRYLTLLALLIMLLWKLSGWRRIVLGIVTAATAVLALVDLILAAQARASIALMGWFALLGAAGLALAVAFGFWEWNRRRWFFRPFCLLALVGIVVYVIPTVLRVNPDTWTPAVVLWPLMGVSMAAAFLSAVTEWGHEEVARRTEARLLAQRDELAQSSYEALRRQNEQVMLLRHDMMKHFRLLRQTTADEKTAAYLDELIGENEKIRPVVQSGNGMLDVILNGKLSAAEDAGIAVEIARMQAPEKLPLSDAELCALVMNIMDNALEAAVAPGVARRYIKLDLHIRNSFFVFICENGATPDWIHKKTAPERGLGLKVIRQIVERHGNLSRTEHGDGYYRVTVALPLHQPLK